MGGSVGAGCLTSQLFTHAPQDQLGYVRRLQIEGPVSLTLPSGLFAMPTVWDVDLGIVQEDVVVSPGICMKRKWGRFLGRGEPPGFWEAADRLAGEMKVELQKIMARDSKRKLRRADLERLRITFVDQAWR